MTEKEQLGPYAAFGAWLREKRVAAKLRSQPQAEIRARARGLKLINQGKLSHVERGMNSNPDPKFLAQLAELYGLVYDDVVVQWVQVKYHVASDAESGLSRHAGDVQPSPHQQRGAADVPAEARIRELRDRLEAYEAIIRHVHEVSAQLVATTAVGAEDRTAARAKTRRGRRDRKAG